MIFQTGLLAGDVLLVGTMLVSVFEVRQCNSLTRIHMCKSSSLEAPTTSTQKNKTKTEQSDNNNSRLAPKTRLVGGLITLEKMSDQSKSSKDCGDYKSLFFAFLLLLTPCT